VLLALPAFIVGGQLDGVRTGTMMAIAVIVVTGFFGRAAYRGTLPRPFNGSGALMLMSLFAAVCVLSVGWSLLPGASYFDAVRVIAYTAILAGGALAAQLIHGRAREVAAGFGLAALIISVYALTSRVVPNWFPESDDFARLRMPFEYWNAVGSVAVFGLIAALWAGTLRHGKSWLNVASYPVGGIFITTLMLSQSRGALLAGLLAIGVWLLVVPRRLRSSGWLVVVTWAYSKPALSVDHVLLDDRKTTGAAFGLILIGMLLVLGGIGYAIERQRLLRPLPQARRYAIGRVLLVVLALSPFVLVAGIGVKSDNGLQTISDGVSNLFDGSKLAPPNSPDRLTQTSSLRARYWSDSYKIFGNHKLHGTGGDTYSVARLPYRHDTIQVLHAHGFVPQVMADLGLIGLLIILALMLVWLVAAFKLIGSAKRSPTKWLEQASDLRIAEVTIMLIALAFGIHSAIDWTWFVPGVAVFGLVAGGWVVGSPSTARLTEPSTISEGTRARAIRAGAIALVGLAVAFAVYQPARAARKVTSGYNLVEDNPGKALELGLSAHKIDPTSPDPFFLIAVAQSNLNMPKAADRTLVNVAQQQPGNPDTWLRLAQFRLTNEKDAAGAIVALQPVLYQSPNNETANALLAEAKEARIKQLVEKAADKERAKIKREILKYQKALEEAGVGATAATGTP
jgi:hypothetical protein